jgi:antitoxin (DNA-binding transcriptional repressor) of toxin-antitoxin stability system
MKTAGIRELKAKLSSYIDAIRVGETIFVTDYGEEVAVMSPLSDEYRLVQLLVKAKRAHWFKGKPAGLDKRVKMKGMPLSKTILEERE